MKKYLAVLGEIGQQGDRSTAHSRVVIMDEPTAALGVKEAGACSN